MSRMTKYLHQRCVLEKLVRNEQGEPLLDKYGEKTYQEPQELKCRRQRESRTVSTSDGLLLSIGMSYHIDEKVEPGVGDKIDGVEIAEISDYIDGRGVCYGYRCYMA